MKLLLTGVAGFVGGHLVELLRAEAPEVHVVGLDSHPGPRVKALAVDVVAADIEDGPAIHAALGQVRPDYIVHLAAQSSPQRSWEDPTGTLRTNVFGLLNLLEGCRRHALCPRVLAVGSAEEYGQVAPEDLPVREDAPLRPLTPYAVSKVAQGYLGLQYALSHGLPVIRTRTFHHTGPRRGEAFAESSFARQLAEIEAGRRPPVLEVGNLTSVRDFADVRDVVRAYWLLLLKGRPGQVYNVCSGTGTRLSELLRVLIDVSGLRIDVRVDPARLRPGDVPELVGDPSRIKADTGWEPAIPLERTLADLLAYWRERVAQDGAGPRTVKVLLTGGTGFLGKNVARRLAAAGHRLRFLVRPGSVREGLPEGAEFAPGDVTDQDSVRRAAEGCQGVMHMAALVKMWVPDRNLFDAVNLGGLLNALAAAREQGARLVYTSSFIAVGPTGAAPADESQRHPGRNYGNDYERTKAAADGLAQQAADQGQDVVRVYPGVVYGPGELTDGNLVVKTLLDHLRGKVPGIIGPGDRFWSYAYVEDVAEGHLHALEKGRSGERYFLAGDNVDMTGYYALLAELTGVRPPRLHIPYAAAWMMGLGLWGWAELTGQEPKLTHQVVNVFRNHWCYSSAKAERELGYRPRPLREGLALTLDWLRRSGRLPATPR